jgi:zinc resistance-associated protein
MRASPRSERGSGSPRIRKSFGRPLRMIRGLATQRREQIGERRDARRQLRDDFPAAIRSLAERQAAHAEALRRVADATAPLYATLDEGQKRRAGLLMRSLRPHEPARAERKGPRGSDRQGRDNG